MELAEEELSTVMVEVTEIGSVVGLHSRNELQVTEWDGDGLNEVGNGNRRLVEVGGGKRFG